MFKPELWQSHNEYRTFVSKTVRKLSRNNPKYSFDSYEEERQKLFNLNLDLLIQFIKDFYSKDFYSADGQLAKHQAQIWLISHAIFSDPCLQNISKITTVSPTPKQMFK